MFEMLFDGSLGAGKLTLLFLCLIAACGFEFVNGFHDTANAVATVIYTKSLRPWTSVIWSGFCNFCGVFLGGIGVALSIINLLPVDLLVSSGSNAGLAMVLALLLAAIIWNLGTWYFGIPASSSHTLIGAIIGVGLANSLTAGHQFGDGVNWAKAGEVGLSLLISPLVGFSLSYLLLLLFKAIIKNPKVHQAPEGETPPPLAMRALLILTCTGVSFAHGSNDGQKGVGLIMLILIGVLPASFALNLEQSPKDVEHSIKAVAELQTVLGAHRRTAPLSDMATPGKVNSPTAQELKPPADTVGATTNVAIVQSELAGIAMLLNGKTSLAELPESQRWELRRNILLVDNSFAKMEKEGALQLSAAELATVKSNRKSLRALTDYAPAFVLVMVALSLGLGTMIGWKRIVVTVGEKIGKEHLTYSQGASAELVAMGTIGLAAFSGLPVSTTHVLSSGIAGTMVAQKSGLQLSVVQKIATAWVLTLPACIALAGPLFLLLRSVMQ
ncbi:MAG: inorganic phosphate transporter [Rhizobacter sp.]|nr:inorganic phosphate transporter [Chlorobiales bacterium]